MASSPYAVRRKLTKVQRERYIGRMRRLFGALNGCVLFIGGEGIELRDVSWTEGRKPDRVVPRIQGFTGTGRVILY